MVSLAEHARTRVAAAAEPLDELTREQRERYARIPEDVDYMPNPSFQDPGAEQDLFGPQAPAVDVPDWTQFPEVPEDIQPRTRSKQSLTAKDEEVLFLRYNYARCRLSRLADEQKSKPTAERARQMLAWHQRVQKVRSDLVRANMPLVLAMAKRTRVPNVEFSELVSEGNMALLRAVEKFDVARGFKFSTYACRAILKGFNRLATKTGRYHQRFPTEYDPDLERSDFDDKRHEHQHEDVVASLREVLARNVAELSEVERTVIMERFAIGRGEGKGRTLSEVGQIVGLTNERVRQIQKFALGKLRAVMDEEAVAS